MSTYRLYYFNGRGRAEVSRLVFVIAGQKYEDIRYEGDQWPKHKSEMPLGQMPVLEVDGVKIPQSATIVRFLAKQFDLAGRDNLEQAKVDAVGDTINDLVTPFIPSRLEQDPVRKEELTKKYFAEDLPKHLKNLEILAELYSDGGPFFVGNRLTWVDLLFYDLFESLLAHDGNCLNDHPWLKQNRVTVEQQPKIAEYLKTRPKTPF